MNRRVIRTEQDKRAVAEKILSLPTGRPIAVDVEWADKRSTDQNALMWAMLTDVARQVEWYGQKLSAEDWKHVFTASQKQQRAVPGIDGGLVMLGQSTSRMSKEQMAELIELMGAFGAEHGVEWSD